MSLWERWSRVVVQPPVLLVAAGVTFALLSFAMAGFRALELRPTAYDLGLYQQALWTGAHGGSYYEAPDWQSAGFASFFEVHLSPLMVVLASVYSTTPSPFTLFAIQSIVVALAAAPLYLLGRASRGSSADGLLAAGLYLVWAPLLAGTLFDFHLESFVPLELFTFLWLWRSRRHLLALPVVFAVGATAEFALPGLAVLGLYEAVRSSPPREGAIPFHRLDRIWKWARQPSTLGGLAIMAVAVFWWVLELSFQASIPSILGSTESVSPPGLSFSSFTNAYAISLSNLAAGLWSKIGAWMLLYALVGFLPWFAPRSQIVAAPWAALSLLQPTAHFVTPGDQHAFLLAVPLFVGVVDGWARLRIRLHDLGHQTAPRETSGLQRRDPWSHALPLLLGALVAANLVLSPIDPLVQQAGDLGPGYGVSYVTGGSYADALAVVDRLPAGSTVLASTDLFPLVANNPNAYVLSGPVSPGGFSHLPFGAANLPPAVLLAEDRIGDVPTWLATSLYNPYFFHLCAVAWDSPVGTVLLFEHPFSPGCPSDSITYFGDLPPSIQSFGPSQLFVGQAGGYRIQHGGTSAVAISSIPGEEGNVWYGPYASLSPGKYDAILSVQAFPWPTSPIPTAFSPVLELTIHSFGQNDWVRTPIDYGVISPLTWGRLIVPFNVSMPSVGVEVVGDQISLEGYFEIYGITIVRTG